MERTLEMLISEKYKSALTVVVITLEILLLLRIILMETSMPASKLMTIEMMVMLFHLLLEKALASARSHIFAASRKTRAALKMFVMPFVSVLTMKLPQLLTGIPLEIMILRMTLSSLA